MPTDRTGRYVVRVPVRTYQTFVVTAGSPSGAKRKVKNWLKGVRNEGNDLEVLDDIGQVSEWLGTRTWEVSDAD